MFKIMFWVLSENYLLMIIFYFEKARRFLYDILSIQYLSFFPFLTIYTLLVGLTILTALRIRIKENKKKEKEELIFNI